MNRSIRGNPGNRNSVKIENHLIPEYGTAADRNPPECPGFQTMPYSPGPGTQFPAPLVPAEPAHALRASGNRPENARKRDRAGYQRKPASGCQRPRVGGGIVVSLRHGLRSVHPDDPVDIWNRRRLDCDNIARPKRFERDRFQPQRVARPKNTRHACAAVKSGMRHNNRSRRYGRRRHEAAGRERPHSLMPSFAHKIFLRFQQAARNLRVNRRQAGIFPSARR